MLEQSIKLIKQLYAQKGRLSWNYRPFRNYRLSQDSYYFRNQFFTKDELLKELTKNSPTGYNPPTWGNWKDYKASNQYPNGIAENEEDPVLYPSGSIVDFSTNKLNFDLKHPVNILTQYSYDGSVNLILNDGKNKPRLINSRFSPTDLGKYQIVDHSGKGTNIYNEASFDLDSSLYKNYIKIPKIEFIDVQNSGNLPIGNYHFYFKYVDEDGNETDFIGESGLVSIFKGLSKRVVNTGFRNENSNKSVLFRIKNIDNAYSYINVYYTKSTSDINENATIQAYKITEKFPVTSGYYCNILINGLQSQEEITVSELNMGYYIANSVKAQAICQNRLFIGNVASPEINYKELSDLSLRFVPTTDTTINYDSTDYMYEKTASGTYYDPRFIYKYTGYQEGEIYRFGIVYILNDNSLTPVFNIRGSLNGNYQQFKIYKSENNQNTRQYIQYNEDSGIINNGAGDLENIWGVFKIQSDARNEFSTVIGITIEPQDKAQLIASLKELNVKGYFFVRQKRIPLRICQAFTIGMLKSNSGVCIPAPYVSYQSSQGYIAEQFHKEDEILTNDFEDHLYFGSTSALSGAICPDYDINSPYLNSLFCGEEYVIKSDAIKHTFYGNSRHFYTSANAGGSVQFITRITGVEDNVKQIELENGIYAGRAGDAENSKYCTIEDKDRKYHRIRGSYGPYLALSTQLDTGIFISIYPKSILNETFQDQFNTRYQDKSPYYAISDRYDIENLTTDTYYRGDSYICMFTHRLNRNFQDSTDPINDDIVDVESFKNRNKEIDGKKQGINIGDLNAIQLGTWYTIPIISNFNLNVRSLDASNVNEKALCGRSRGFYPYYEAIPSGNLKIPEALCYNKGFQKSVSDRVYFLNPQVPSIKNDFTNRIYYSNINVQDAFKNGFRTFPASNYRDYSKEYGSIIKLIELSGNLLCVFEHGIGLIPVNERVAAGEGAGGNVYINTNNVLPQNLNVLSDVYGSQWADSVIKTPNAIYGVDTVQKVIWKTDGSQLQVISNFEIQEFLNNNLTLSELETEPIIGVRNVKTHYNAFKNDVMFTFYNCLKGFQEKSWNICFNEIQNKWVTFYSWIPSFSENIDKQFFTFDRTTSKWISKLALSSSIYSYADGIVLEGSNIISPFTLSGTNYCIGTLKLVNRLYPKDAKVTFHLKHDIFGNYKKFTIINDTLYCTCTYEALCSELYQRGTINSDGDYNIQVSKFPRDYSKWRTNCVQANKYIICKDEYERNLLLEEPYNISNIVCLLNIEAKVTIDYTNKSLYKDFLGEQLIDSTQLSSTIALIPFYNQQFLTTNFWKHGQAGIIDIADTIKPCNWYGKQHPFEFEFVVNDNIQYHKIFDNLQIISNNAEPESFHYEVVGDTYEFAKDKKNMYIRQEATKNLYQYNKCDITYDSTYLKLNEQHRLLDGTDSYDKSTLLPLYYSRQDTINEIEDSYHLKNDVSTKDFSALSGSEVVYNKKMDEYRIWSHAKAINMNNNRTKGNMRYLEDRWDIQINSINLVQKNEKEWGSEDLLNRYNLSNKIPIEINQSPIPNEVLQQSSIDIPDELQNRAIVKWNWEESQNKEVKIKDKYVKIRIRYTGNKLAIIYAINTLYRINNN